MNQEHIETLYGEIRAKANEISFSGDYEGAIEYLKAEFFGHEDPTDPYVHGFFWRSCSLISAEHDHHQKALDETRRSASFYLKAGDKFEAAKSKTIGIQMLGLLNQVEEAEKLAADILPEFSNFVYGQLLVKTNLASVYSAHGDAERAAAISLELHQISKKEGLEKDAYDYLVEVALQMVILGQLDESISIFEKAQAEFDQIPHGRMKDIYATRLALHHGNALILVGRFEEALSLFSKARSGTFLGSNFDRAFFDLKEGMVRSYLGDVELAEYYFSKAREQFVHPIDNVEAELHYCHFLRSRGSTDRLQTALELTESSLGHLNEFKHPPLLSEVYKERAEIFFTLNRISEAREAIDSALNIKLADQRPFFRKFLTLVWAEINLIHQPAEAQTIFEEIIRDDSLPTEIHIRAWEGLAKARTNQNAYRLAANAYEQAITLTQAWRRHVSGHPSQAGFMRRVQAPLRGLFDNLTMLRGDGKEILQHLERVNGQMLNDFSTMARLSAEDDQLGSLFIKREQLLRQLDLFMSPPLDSSKDPETHPSADKASREKQRLVELKGEIVRIEGDIRRAFPEWGQPDHAPQTGTSLEILPPETALLTWFEAGQDLFVMTMLAGEIQYQKLETSLEEIVERWRKLYFAYGRRRRQSSLQARSAELWQSLIGPLRATLEGSTALSIIPHQQLWQIPFASLFDSTSGQPVSKRWFVTHLPSLALGQRSGRLEANGDGVLLVGESGHPDYPPVLPAVMNEISALADMLPHSQVLLDAEATRETLLDQLEGNWLIHFAGHINFDPQRPEYSGIRLHDNRYLRATDLYLRPGILAGAHVVLSGCDSGRVGYGGSEIVGLIGALLAAGAKSVLVTLWPVEDVAVSHFMTLYYAELIAGASSATALQRAQTKMREGEFSHPVDWGAFISLCA